MDRMEGALQKREVFVVFSQYWQYQVPGSALVSG